MRAACIKRFMIERKFKNPKLQTSAEDMVPSGSTSRKASQRRKRILFPALLRLRLGGGNDLSVQHKKDK